MDGRQALSGVGRLIKLVVRAEIAIWAGLWRWIARRPVVPEGAEPLPYARQVTPVLWLFIWGSALEVVAMDLIINHFGWNAVRLPVLILGIWGVLWMLGMMAAYRTRPHLVFDDHLRISLGLHHSIDVPLGAVASVSPTEAELSSSMKSSEVVDDRLLIGISGRTNLMLQFDAPTTIATPKGDEQVSAVGLWVDEPREVASRLRGHPHVGAGPQQQHHRA